MSESKKAAPEVVKGKATYRLTKPHYRKGRLYAKGETITVVDEAPSKTWVRVEEAEVKAATVAAPPETGKNKRASERDL